MSAIPAMDPADYFALAVDRFHAMGAPLYAVLSAAAVNDQLVCDIAGRAQPGQPVDHLVFAAVEVVLAEYPDDPLAKLLRPTGRGGVPAGLADAFHRFCETHRQAIEAMVSSRTVQTTPSSLLARAWWLTKWASRCRWLRSAAAPAFLRCSISTNTISAPPAASASQDARG